MSLLIAVVLSGAVQDTTIMLDNVAGWWMHFPSCERRLAAVDAVNLPNDGADEWCLHWNRLHRSQRRTLFTATYEHGIRTWQRMPDTGDWWDSLSVAGRSMAIGHDGAPLGSWASLTRFEAERATAAYDALAGETPDPNPRRAVPFVALFVLGALLAVRGALLRRRR